MVRGGVGQERVPVGEQIAQLLPKVQKTGPRPSPTFTPFVEGLGLSVSLAKG